MARVDYNPIAGVQPSAAATPYISENTPPGAFGGTIAGAEEKLGGSEEQGGGKLFEAGVQSVEFATNQQVKNTLFNEVGPAMDKQFTDYTSLKGKAAVDGYEPFMEGMAKLINDKAKGMSPYGQSQFLDNAHYLYQRIDLMASEHRGRQADAYDTATNQLAVENLTTQGVLFQNDPLTVIKNGEQIRAQAQGLALKQGFAPGSPQNDAAISTALGGYYSRVISSKMYAPPDQGGGALPASALFDRVRPYMDARSIDAIERMLHPEVVKQQGENDASTILQGLGTSQGAAPGGYSGPKVSPDQMDRVLWNQESGGSANAPTSVTGAAGGHQIQPATFQQYARPGERIDVPADNAAVGKRITADYVQKYDGDPARVAVAYFSGPDNVAPAGSATPWLEDKKDPTGKSTSSYVGDVLKRIGQAPGAGEGAASPSGWHMPDWGKAEEQALAIQDPERRDAALASLSRTRQRVEMATRTERADLTHNFGNLEKAAEDGVPIVIPDYSRAFEPDDAARLTSQLQVAQAGGQIMSSLKFASPQQLADAVTDLASGTGTYSDSIRSKLVKTLGGGAVTPAGGKGEESPEFYTQRTQMAAKAIQLIQQRQKALTEDPAGYAAQEPTVAIAAKAMDPKNPDTFGAYARATLAVQDHLGVRPEAQHVLVQQQAETMVQDLMKPGMDTKQQLDGLAQQWGDAWPHVYADMVTMGKMPAEMQGVSALPDPKDAALLARAIQEQAKSGKQWSDILGAVPGTRGTAYTDLLNIVRADGQMEALRRSWAASGATIPQIDNMQHAVEMLAFAKKLYTNSALPAQEAVKAFTDQYHFMPNGGARLPAAQADTIEQNAGVTLQGLNLDKIVVPRGFRTEDTEEARRLNPLSPAASDYLANLQANPTWITSPKGDAIWLLDNGARLVRDKQGNPISVPFNAKAMGPVLRPALSDEPVPGGGMTP